VRRNHAVLSCIAWAKQGNAELEGVMIPRNPRPVKKNSGHLRAESFGAPTGRPMEQGLAVPASFSSGLVRQSMP
jgi:hypothetical protein